MYEQNKLINYSDCDYTGKLSVIKFFDMTENMVSLMFKTINLDNYTMESKFNSMWVFTKNRVSVYSLPKWSSKVKLVSKIIKSTNIRCYVETSMFDENGEICCSSILECAALDKASFRIKRLSTFELPPTNIDMEITYSDFEINDLDFIKSLPVTVDLIDYSLHVNNVEYLRLIYSTFTMDDVSNFHFKYMDIAYLSQTMIGEELSIYGSKDKMNFLIKKQDKDVLKVKFIK